MWGALCIKITHLTLYWFLSLTVLRVAAYGKDVKALVEQPLEEELMHPGKNTVTYEARLLKALMLDLM